MRLQYVFYAAALVATVGMWFQWSWVIGAFDGWFPAFAIAVGQVIRLKSGAPETILDRAFQAARIQRAVIASILLMGIGIAGWAAWFKLIHQPANERAGVAAYLEAREKALRSGK